MPSGPTMAHGPIPNQPQIGSFTVAGKLVDSEPPPI